MGNTAAFFAKSLFSPSPSFTRAQTSPSSQMSSPPLRRAWYVLPCHCVVNLPLPAAVILVTGPTSQWMLPFLMTSVNLPGSVLRIHLPSIAWTVSFNLVVVGLAVDTGAGAAVVCTGASCPVWPSGLSHGRGQSARMPWCSSHCHSSSVASGERVATQPGWLGRLPFLADSIAAQQSSPSLVVWQIDLSGCFMKNCIMTWFASISSVV
mmetsp:Transcript_62831/g.141962  ORF Transcript_62831/g.141962 Transcript_62831/m.141962 type:complete len:208 (+) Transcript_62831:442-1065(+)